MKTPGSPKTHKSRLPAAVLLAGIAALAWGLPATFAALDSSERPNILLIVVDDLGYGELGCQGNPQVPTPNMDSLAQHGVRFTSGYVTAPFCAPSRAGFLTGHHQARFGYDINPTGAHNLKMRLQVMRRRSTEPSPCTGSIYFPI